MISLPAIIVDKPYRHHNSRLAALELRKVSEEYLWIIAEITLSEIATLIESNDRPEKHKHE